MPHQYNDQASAIPNWRSCNAPSHGQRERMGSLAGIATLLVVMVLLAFPQSVALADEMVRIKVKTANVRSGPGTKYKKVWEVPRNYPYRVISRKGRWMKVKDFEGFEDWIFSSLTDRRPAVVVKVKRANARTGPGKKYPVIFTADSGVAFEVLGKRGDWIQVRANDGDQGWIFKTLLWGFFDSSEKTPTKSQKK